MMGREFRLVFDRCSVARCDGSSGHCWRFLLTHSGTAVQGHTCLALPGHTVANYGVGLTPAGSHLPMIQFLKEMKFTI
jgi:hypothetical protein